METPDQPAAQPDPAEEFALAPTAVVAESEHVPPRASRRTVLAWVGGVASVVAVAGVIAFVHVSANQGFDDAHAALSSIAEAGAETADDLATSAQTAESTLVSGEDIVESATDELVDPAARSAFVVAMDATAAAATDAEALLVDELDDGAAEKPFWTWELFAAASDLEERADAAAARTDQMTEVGSRLDAAQDTMLTAATALYASAAPAAAALETANVSATWLAVLDFREAAEAVTSQTMIGSGASVAFTTYAARAQVLRESAASELAEKAGPLLATRLEIEAYARSISGGVVLDFDWAPVVAGVGGSSGIGGTATWNTARGGSSTITLSNSVAEEWPSADARALVTHEVGHAITSKCYEKFDWEDQAANEEWATAWAISMGHTSEGNGVQAYGYPSQTMIDAAATCR